uniref:Dynamin-type G domain-containing protein n=1 Tax=Panagrolaimus sp. ES5 TaxID=591445 RepID=A0AC34FXV1_9BILA
MILSYIENPQTIILAVTPANQDLANSEALKLAREVDPHGDRTLCVLTKLDLMDRGTNAMKVLRGETIPVKLGIIGVVNRSQEDINLNQSIEDCLKNEKSFLHDNYRPLALKNGTKYLAKTLNKLLIDHIRESLPDLKERVSKMTIDFQKNLDEIGEAVVDHKKTFFQVLSRYSSAYITTLDGSSTDVESSDLIGGARICSIFYEEFEKDINSIDSMGDLTVEEVLSAIKNSSGLKPPILIPERSFDTLVKKQMQRFKIPMLRCVKLVYDELVRIIQHCSVEVQRFPLLYDRIRKVISTFLLTRFIKTKKFVGRLLDIEIAFINTKHPELESY